MRRITLITAALIAGALLTTGCSDDDNGGDDPTTVAGSPVATGTADPNVTPGAIPTYQTTPRPATSGIATADEIITATQAQDLDALQDRLVFGEVECAANPPQGAGGPPRCRPDEDDGTEVEVISLAACEGFFSREDELKLEDAPITNAIMHSVWRAPDGLFPAGDYVILFSRIDPHDGVPVFALIGNDDGITGIDFGCGQSAEQIIATRNLTEAIVPPL